MGDKCGFCGMSHGHFDYDTQALDVNEHKIYTGADVDLAELLDYDGNIVGYAHSCKVCGSEQLITKVAKDTSVTLEQIQDIMIDGGYSSKQVRSIKNYTTFKGLAIVLLDDSNIITLHI